MLFLLAIRGEVKSMTAAETYASQIDDFNAQEARIYGDRLPPDTWATGAASFR